MTKRKITKIIDTEAGATLKVKHDGWDLYQGHTAISRILGLNTTAGIRVWWSYYDDNGLVNLTGETELTDSQIALLDPTGNYKFEFEEQLDVETVNNFIEKLQGYQGTFGGISLKDLSSDLSEKFDEVHEPKGYHLDDKGTELKHLLNSLLYKFRGVKAFYVGNVLKYVLRHQDKNGKQDLLKAKEYIDMLIEEYYGDED